VKKRFNKTVRETPYQVKDICIYLHYGDKLELRLLIPEKIDNQVLKIISPLKNKHIKDVRDLLERIRTIEEFGCTVTIYPDAEEYINKTLYRERVKNKVTEIRNDPAIL